MFSSFSLYLCFFLFNFFFLRIFRFIHSLPFCLFDDNQLSTNKFNTPSSSCRASSLPYLQVTHQNTKKEASRSYVIERCRSPCSMNDNDVEKLTPTKRILLYFTYRSGVLDLISGGSRSTTPTSSLMARKSPTMDQGTQVGHQQQRSNNANVHKPMNDKTNARTIQPPYRDRERCPKSFSKRDKNSSEINSR